jgi:hypothetical protein
MSYAVTREPTSPSHPVAASDKGEEIAAKETNTDGVVYRRWLVPKSIFVTGSVE